MTYRLLPQSEWHRLAADFRAQGKPLPHDGSRIAVAEDGDGQIRGFLVLQWVPHMEPLSIAAPWRGKVYWPTLLHLLEREFQGGGEYYAFAPDDHMAAFAMAAACEPLDWIVFRKEVR